MSKEEIIQDLKWLNIDSVETNALITNISNESNDEKLENFYEQLLAKLITNPIKIEKDENGVDILEVILIKIAKLLINNEFHQNNINFLNKLFYADENFLEQDENGNTILHTAISLKLSSNIFEFIFLAYEPWEINNNMSEEDKTENEKKNVELKTEFSQLLNCQDNNGNTALHLAINNKQYELAKKLISYGAQTNIENKNKEQALNLLIEGFAAILPEETIKTKENDFSQELKKRTN